jgi:hypothetical protein
MSFERQLEKEVELIENDDTLTNEEKRKLIKELYRDAIDMERERRAMERDFDERY